METEQFTGVSCLRSVIDRLGNRDVRKGRITVERVKRLKDDCVKYFPT